MVRGDAPCENRSVFLVWFCTGGETDGVLIVLGLFVEGDLLDDVAAGEFDPFAAVAADAVAELEEGCVVGGAAFGAGDSHREPGPYSSESRPRNRDVPTARWSRIACEKLNDV